MATIDAKDLGAFAREYAELRGQDLEKTSRGFFINLSTSIILKTPVGNPSLWKSKAPAGYTGGRARNNWFASANSKSNETTKASGPKGSAAINRASKVGKAHKIGQTMYLSNNLPYIRPLEFVGWSTQAPAGMVRITLTEATKALQLAVNNLKKGN